MGLVRLARARTDRDHRAPGAATVPRNPSVDEIQEPLATPDRGLLDEGLRVRGRIGTADASLRTAALRRRILGAMGRGTWLRESWKKDRRRIEAFLRDHALGLPAVTITVATERASKAFRAELREKAKARTLEKNLRPNRKSGS